MVQKRFNPFTQQRSGGFYVQDSQISAQILKYVRKKKYSHNYAVCVS